MHPLTPYYTGFALIVVGIFLKVLSESMKHSFINTWTVLRRPFVCQHDWTEMNTGHFHYHYCPKCGSDRAAK